MGQLQVVRRGVLAAVLWLVGSAALGGWAVAGPVVALAPHRAVYDLKLDEAKSGSGIVGVTGRIVYELTGSACEGYTQSMRFVTATTNQDGDTQTTDLRTSSWEDVPAHRFRFSTTTYRNEILAEQTQGAVERQGEGASGPAEVEIKRPQKRTVKLPVDVYFPIQHSMAIIKAARAGKHILTADLFDGSESGDKLYSTSTAIGRESKPGGGPAVALSRGSGALDKVASWPISVSYFRSETSRSDTVPLYEMSYRFHDNGVTSSLRIDHGDFAIEGELKELSYLEASTCK